MGLWRGERVKTYCQSNCGTKICKEFKETKDLSELICSVKKEITKKHPATKSFQALRIAVNDEIESLRDCLVNIKTKIKKGGRIVIISFHSLEDRIAKMSFKEEVNLIEKKIPLINNDPPKEFKVSKIIYPDEQELSNNIRSRSAKMRVIENYENHRCSNYFFILNFFNFSF